MNAIRLFQRPLALFLVSIIALGSSGCYARRQMPISRLNKIKTIEELQFFVVDTRTSTTAVWALSEPNFQKQALEARVERPSERVAQAVEDIRGQGDMRNNRNRVLIYLHPSASHTLSDSITTRLNYADIERIEVFEADAGKAIGLVLAIAGATVLTIGLLVVIACACPHVYAETADGARFEGELFGGAIYPQLERHDWLPVRHLQPIDNQYKIRLSNRQRQHQHTNLLALEVLDHAPGLRPLFDQRGRLHTVAAPQPPGVATDASGRDILPDLLSEDDRAFIGDPKNDRPDATDQLTLTFAKPASARQAKLVLNAKNNIWLDYTYHEFLDALGQYADEVQRKYAKLPAAEHLAWAERQKIPLAVWLETAPGQWEKAGSFNVAGPMGFRNDVLPIDLSRLQGDRVRLRLDFGFRFWEIDYAALDFSPDQPVRQTTLRPRSAVTQTGEDMLAALLADDQRYYDQPAIGDEARIAFEAPPLVPGLERSLVVHAKGHYEILHDPAPGRPGIFKLKAWEKENALPKLARDRWRAAAIE